MCTIPVMKGVAKYCIIAIIITIIVDSVDTSMNDRIYYLHIHKSGGSTICEIAKVNGLTKGEYNCNVPPNERHLLRGTPQEQKRLYNKISNRFIANEDELADEVDWELYSYMTVIRHPFTRAYSHYNHAKGYHKLDISFKEWVTNRPDNILTRILCGTSCMEVKQGHLNDTHLNKAMYNLHHFDVVFTLENLHRSMGLLKDIYGLKQVDSDKYRKGTLFSTKHDTEAILGDLFNKDAEFAEFMNLHYSMDLIIYSYADYINKNMLHDSNAEQIRSIYKDCDNKCCSNACSKF